MAKSRSIGSIYAELTVRDKMSRALKSARKSMNDFGRAGVKYASITTAVLGAATLAGTKRTLELGAELDHLKRQTGISAGGLALLGQAYKDNGRDAKSVAKDIGKMQAAIDDASKGGTKADTFKELGLDVAALLAMDPANQFWSIGKAIGGITSQTAKAAAVMDLFGRSGADLITVFEGSNLDDVQRSLGGLPKIMDKFSGAMERADTLLGRLPNKSDAFFAGFTSGVIGELLPALEMTNDYDFTKLGQNFGQAISKGVELLRSGGAWEIFELQGEKTFLGLAQQGEALFRTLMDPQIYDLLAKNITRAIGQGAKDGNLPAEVLNAWSAAANAVVDIGGLKGGETFDFWASFDKYSQAGMADLEEISGAIADLPSLAESYGKALDKAGARHADRLLEIQDRIDGINKRAEDAVSASTAAAAAISAETAAAIDAATSKIPSFSSIGTPAQNIANEYQRRGLSLDAGGGLGGMRGDMGSLRKSVETMERLISKHFSVRRELRI